MTRVIPPCSQTWMMGRDASSFYSRIILSISFITKRKPVAKRTKLKEKKHQNTNILFGMNNVEITIIIIPSIIRPIPSKNLLFFISFLPIIYPLISPWGFLDNTPKFVEFRLIYIQPTENICIYYAKFKVFVQFLTYPDCVSTSLTLREEIAREF
jgi:hypothetical protein